MIQEIFAEELVSPQKVGFVIQRIPRVRLEFDNRTGKILRIKSLSKKIFKSASARSKNYFGVIIPGLVDPHTHLIFAGNRSGEWNRRLKGDTYQKIASEGGGIKTTVRATREASLQELAKLGRSRLKTFLEFGVTTLEAKTGYGLDLDTELKILRVLSLLKSKSKTSIFRTFMGAHAVAAEFKSAKAYVEYLIEEVLPKVSGEAEFQDVFVERGYFGIPESVRLLEEGKKYGLKPKVHAHEFGRTGGVEVAWKVGAVSADHLQYLNQTDIRRMKAKRITPVVLPSTSLFLGGKKFADAGKMIQSGLDLAVASDFNPGTNPSQNFPLAGTFAAIFESMSLDQVLVAQTRNAAKALGLKDRGVLTPGMRADFVCLDADRFEEMYYYFGKSLVRRVYINGRKAL